MPATIFTIDESGSLIELNEAQYDSEDLLQRFLAEHPSLLPGDQINSDEPRRWLLIRREAAVPDSEYSGGRWSVDHLFLDQDAVPTFIEVKRSTDTRIRREVVGQMLDYAANAVVYWSVASLRAQFEAQCTSDGSRPDETLENFTGPGIDEEHFWQRVKTNLQAGRVRLLFVSDVIPKELQRVVEFLNEQMDPAEVLAIEIKQFQGSGLRTLVPTVLGNTVAAQQTKNAARPTTQWTEETHLQKLAERHGEEAARVAASLLRWAESESLGIYWGRGATMASFIPWFAHGGLDYQVFAVYSYGSIEIYFQHLLRKPPFDAVEMREELRQKLNAIEGIEIPPDGITRRPSIPILTLSDEQKLNEFIEVFRWVVSEIKKT